METIGDMKLYSFDEVKDELIGKKGSKARDDYEMKMKLTRFAMSRGFDYDIIKDCTDDIIKGDAD